MLTRRIFAGCAICAATDLIATGADAQTTPPASFQRFILQQMDGPAEGYTTLIARVEVVPSGLIARHTHPGIESGVVLEGSGSLAVQGRPDLNLSPGASYQVPPVVVHSLQNGSAPMKLVVSFTVEKGKPLASPAP